MRQIMKTGIAIASVVTTFVPNTVGAQQPDRPGRVASSTARGRARKQLRSELGRAMDATR